MNKPATPEEIGKRTLAQEERTLAANQDMARAAKNMTTEEMAKRIEAHAIWMGDVHGCQDPESEAELAAIARRLRLLEAEKQAWRFLDGVSVGGLVIASEVVSKARAALDADERGGKDG